jgi:hypothetical protein
MIDFWPSVGVALGGTSLLVVTASVFALVDRIHALQTQITDLRVVIDAIIDERLHPIRFTTEGAVQDQD